MRKLALRVEDLRVATFATADEETAPRGTVRGHDQEDREPGPPTNVSCANTCTCPTWADRSCYPQTYCVG